MKDETLLPCPFCGGKAEFDRDDDGLNWISCSTCGVSTDTAYHTDVDARETLRDVWNRRPLQSGNSGQVPAGYVLVPVEPTQEMIDAHVEGVQSGGMRKGYRAMLAASPPVSDGWIPVNERMPEPGRWLALYGAPVYTHGPDAGKPWRKFTVGEGYLDKEDGKFYLLNWESPGEIGDSYNNLLAIATHWMYWELPDAPKVKP